MFRHWLYAWFLVANLMTEVYRRAVNLWTGKNDRNILDGGEERQNPLLSRHKAKRLMSFCCSNQIQACWSPIFVVSSTWTWRRIRLYRREMWRAYVKQIISIFHQDFDGRLRCFQTCYTYLFHNFCQSELIELSKLESRFLDF